jgi:hypothetical protein
MRSWRALIGLLGALVVGAVIPALSSASNHEIKIREVYAGSAASPNSEYVELQMYAPGQNLFHLGTKLDLYNATGTITEHFVPGSLPSDDPPNSASQQRVLFANVGAKTQFSVTAGYTLPMADAISDAGGAVCYTSTAAGSFIDCVSWGNFSGSLPSAAGGNVDPGGIGDTKAINRSITAGCSTMLEAGDDTNKPADWSDVTPIPLNNAATPPEQACPATTITKGPKAKTTDKTPTFKFKASGSGVTFQCKVDKGHFASCTSPFTTAKLAKGKHTFQVRGTNNSGGVGNAAKKTFTVVKKKRHHH